ncbi:hypothetical protein FDUTEX481_09837 [Tolypothrix sp. PCC 7601]|nr:hypothetical protein FDUTEX481_09837 [Tolypothrix sp. PCC 7601]
MKQLALRGRVPRLEQTFLGVASPFGRRRIENYASYGLCKFIFCNQVSNFYSRLQVGEVQRILRARHCPLVST